jgi:hypothetical protein
MHRPLRGLYAGYIMDASDQTRTAAPDGEVRFRRLIRVLAEQAARDLLRDQAAEKSGGGSRRHAKSRTDNEHQ